MKLILASGSPRRREILTWAGLPFEVFVSDADESLDGNPSPDEAVKLISAKKADAVRAAHPEFQNYGTLILAADTVVDLDGEVFGKPRDRADAERMLRAMSGREHLVHTGVTLICGPEGGKRVSSCESTKVRIAELSDSDIDWYISSAEPYDKAGSYAIQGLFSRFVSGIEGDYFNVMGLPIHRVMNLLKYFSVDPQSFD